MLAICGMSRTKMWIAAVCSDSEVSQMVQREFTEGLHVIDQETGCNLRELYPC